MTDVCPSPYCRPFGIRRSRPQRESVGRMPTDPVQWKVTSPVLDRAARDGLYCSLSSVDGQTINELEELAEL